MLKEDQALEGFKVLIVYCLINELKFLGKQPQLAMRTEMVQRNCQPNTVFVVVVFCELWNSSLTTEN